MDIVVRPNPASIEVICLGHSRTGTSSLSAALNKLGFGPCYHLFEILEHGGNDFPAWFKISDGLGTFEDLDTIFRSYRSVLDQPPALFAAEMYAAYPQAKFILTTRDPAKWEQSMIATVLHSIREIEATPIDQRTPVEESLAIWDEHHLAKYHRGRLFSHTQQELLDHNERVKRIIPPEKLLIYEVGEGWDRLVDFLGVPKPNIPFPHLNTAAQFQAIVAKLGGENRINASEAMEEG